MVVIVHCGDLSQATKLLPITGLVSSRVAVEGFFAISGCLIVASWDRSKTPSGYFRRRGQRILPAYWFALLYTVILGIIVTKLPLAIFLRSPTTWKYVFCNLVFVNFLQSSLPGVFSNNVFQAMNGALWTIKVEVSFYLLVPLIVWLCRHYGVVWILGSIFVLSSIYRVWMDAKGHESLANQLPGQLAYFAVGAAVYFCFPMVSTLPEYDVDGSAVVRTCWMLFRVVSSSRHRNFSSSDVSGFSIACIQGNCALWRLLIWNLCLALSDYPTLD